MAWHVAASLETLRRQLNEMAPNRSKVSDGGIGDAAHATRDSDHNPWYRDTVTARDFTHDPPGGLDCHRLADALQRARDRRIKYVIWDRRIMSGAPGPQPWTWRPYSGTNPHTRHLHLSVVASPLCEDAASWDLGTAATRPTIQRGDTGPDVELIQRFLGVVGPGDFGYGNFGPATEAAVRRYQEMRGLEVDGIVGEKTWRETGL